MFGDKIENLVLEVVNYLEKVICKNAGFPSRSFYGESFTLLLLHKLGRRNFESYKVLLNAYDKKDQLSDDFHFEFNNYAFSSILDNNFQNNEIKDRLYPLKFKNTNCTNWTLLRCNTKIKLKKDVVDAIQESKDKINTFQLGSGLILDDPGVKSFQYHCFSMAMIAEIYFTTKDEFYLKSFLKGVDFIRKFVLPNGQTLYIGRGQEQSFGYGTLIYILSIYYSLTRNIEVLTDINLVLSFLESHEYNQGDFPLVMNSVNKEMKEDVDLNDPNYAGWYQYNNYYDYLPFMAVFLYKAIQYLPKDEIKIRKTKKVENYRDENFMINTVNDSIVVLSRPGGYVSNDLSIPLVYKNQKLLTPIYGGDHFFRGKLKVMSPIPYFPKLDKTFNWRLKSFFLRNYLICFSPLGILVRKFRLSKTSLIISSFVLSPFKVYQLFFNFRNKNIVKTDAKVYNFKDQVISPLGMLKGSFTKGFYQQIKIELNE